MKKKNVSIADFEGFFIECENDIALNNHFNDLTKIRIKNLELINKSMRNLDIESLPFTKKEFNTFLTMTELVEDIFNASVEKRVKSNDEFIQDLLNERDYFKNEINSLDKEKSLLNKNVKKFKSKIKQLKKENRKLKANLKELAKEFYNSDKFSRCFQPKTTNKSNTKVAVIKEFNK